MVRGVVVRRVAPRRLDAHIECEATPTRPDESPARADADAVLGTGAGAGVARLAPRPLEPELECETRRDPFDEAPPQTKLAVAVGKPESELGRRRQRSSRMPSP